MSHQLQRRGDRYFKKELPSLKIVLLACFERNASGTWLINTEELLMRAVGCHTDGLALYTCDGLTASLVKDAKKAGRDLFVWVVDNEPLALKITEIVVETIATNLICYFLHFTSRERLHME